MVLPDGADAVRQLRADGRDARVHQGSIPPLQADPGARRRRAAARRPAASTPRCPTARPDPGLIIASDASAATDDFVAAIAKHRHFARETDPPRV